ncbi:MAG TPA: aromatic amino acid lyase, partial [Solirubrobacteraceae bacterium]
MPTLEDLERIARGGSPAPLTDEDRARIAAARAVVDDALASASVVYGVTTGIGNLASVRIGADDAA